MVSLHVMFVYVYMYTAVKKTHGKNKYYPLIIRYTLHILTLFTVNHVAGINHDGSDIQVYCL